jgi:hypothetical protein
MPRGAIIPADVLLQSVELPMDDRLTYLALRRNPCGRRVFSRFVPGQTGVYRNRLTTSSYRDLCFSARYSFKSGNPAAARAASTVSVALIAVSSAAQPNKRPVKATGL